MTTGQAVHLIEQFAAQSPFAIWITDSSGVAIFANSKLHEIFQIQQRPSGAVGMNLFDDEAVAQLGFDDVSARIRSGEVVSAVIEIPKPGELHTAVAIARKEPLIIRLNAFPLRSSSQKTEYFVLVLQDVTETYAQREDLRKQIRDIELFRKSKETRLTKMEELQREVARLEADIRSAGATPEI